MGRRNSSVIRFHGFALDTRNASLRKSGAVVRLPPQPFKALAFLASRPQQLVTREELRCLLWGDEVVVDFEHGLNTCIRQIRTALGDSAEGGRIIETVPKLGYRFTARTENPRIGHRAAAAGIALMLSASVLVWWLRADAAARRHGDAVALYVRGLAAIESRSDGADAIASQLFQRAGTLDARYAEPHAGLARLYLSNATALPGVSPREALSRAAEETARALAIDDASPEAHLAMANLSIARADPQGADAAYARAIALAPQYATAREEYGLWLAEQGRFDEALAEGRLAEKLDPLSPRGFWVATCALRWARRYDSAIVEARRGLAVNPTFGPLHHELAVCYEAQGDFGRAFDEFGQEGHRGGNLGHAYALAGRTNEARAVIRTLEDRWATSHAGAAEIAQVYIGLGELDRAFEWLAKDPAVVLTLKVAAVWDPLRGDPRFAPLLRRSPFR